MRVLHVCTIICILAMLGAAQAALGATYYFWGSDEQHTGYWNVPEHWRPSGTPGPNDTAIIGDVNGEPTDMRCYVTNDQSVGTLVVKGTGTT